MNWVESIRSAVDYMEANMKAGLSADEIAKHALLSPFYFQKGFSMLCGMTVGEYIRRRRLALSGLDLISTDRRIMDIALDYGYDSPDSFTKAFTRFHGVTPTAVRKEGAMVRSFAPLKIKFSLEGGTTMDYKIIEKDAFEVLGVCRTFRYEEAPEKVPAFWAEHYQNGGGETVCGMYGINMDESMGSDTFDYWIADDYFPGKEVPQGFARMTIPKFTWAVFACRGPIPARVIELSQKIYTEWLPNCSEYEIAAGYFIEMYTDITEYPHGNQDADYYCEMWIPVKKK